MRFDTPVYFQRIEAGEYDTNTGNYIGAKPIEEKVYADVTESATETLQLIYGEIKQGVLTIRLQQPYIGPIDSIRVGEKKYRVDWSRKKRVFVVSEVQ